MPAIAESPHFSRTRDFPYFRRIWKNVVVALLATSFIPLITIGGGMYYYSTTVLKQKTLESLRSKVVSHKETLDRFLTERTMDLKLISENLQMEELIRPGVLENVLDSLQKGLPYFQDLGIIDDQGRHLAYVGPFQLLSETTKRRSGSRP